MRRATPKMRDFATRLVVCETRGDESSKTETLAGFHVCEKLRPQLATLMGKAGYRALLSRALTLASVEVARLFGGSMDNTFDITTWDGTAYIYGAGGSNDANEELRVRAELRDAESQLQAARQALVGANQNLQGFRQGRPPGPLEER